MTELLFFVVTALILAVIWLVTHLRGAEDRIGQLADRLSGIEAELRRERSQKTTAAEPAARETPPPVQAPPAPVVPIVEPREAVPPPLPAMAAKSAPIQVAAWKEPVPPKAEPATETPPTPPPAPLPVPEEKREPLLPEFTLEAFMGVKLFAWLGGLALFLGIIFFVRYAFEHGLISEQMRIALGALTGLGLVVGGLFIPRPKYAVTAQTLCATGVVVLYGVTYSAYALYQFVEVGTAFGIMAAITAGAFLLAVRLNAQVVAILGLLAGFLTPIILSTGQDKSIELFTYLAVLDAGLMAVALRQRWRHLILLAAAATALMQMGWFSTFFNPSKLGIATTVFLGFEALFLVPFWLIRRDKKDEDHWTAAAALLMGATALGFTAALLRWPELGAKPLTIFAIVMLADLGLVAVALRQRWHPIILLTAAATALMQIGWFSHYFNPSRLGVATTIFLGFEALFLVLFWLIRRDKKDEDRWTAAAALLMGATALGFTAALLRWPELGARPLTIFAIVMLADLGLVAVGLRQRWLQVVTAVAGATALIQISWATTFFAPAGVGTATLIFLGFEALFLLPFWRYNSDETGEQWTTLAAGIMAATGLGYAASLLAWPELGAKPWISLSILMLADAGLVAWPLRRTVLQIVPMIGGAFVFVVLGIWNIRYLNDRLLGWALGFFLLFAAFHTMLPIVLRRLRPAAATPRWAQVFPALGLILMLWPAFESGASTSLWAAILLADLAAIALAVFTGSVLGVVAALILTLVAIALWLVRTPVDNPSIAGLLTVIAGFTALFCGASVFLQRRLAASGLVSPASAYEKDALQHLPAISAVLPFLLLVSVVERLHPINPSAVFGVGLLLVVMLLALARWSDTLALPPIALGCGVVLEYAWHAQNWNVSNSVVDPGGVLEQAWRAPGISPPGGLALAWYLGFAAIIAAFPFVFQSRLSRRVIPWATAALAPVVHYPLVRDAAAHTWAAFDKTAPGLIPAAFALPALAACEYLRRVFPRDNPAWLAVLAWFGGTALFFITLIFPAQFDHEWLTISWALEGAALCWLFHRLPHPGLQLVGFGLLVVAFVRLSINPYVLGYHDRSGVPIWNWYLYTYGLVAAATFAGGYLLKPPRHRLGEINACATLFSLGTILLFFLLNIEIADFFATGPTLTFDFSGDLGRDMTYSIAWALFALGLLLVGMHRRLAPVRYTGIGLFVVTLAKLFLHDLAELKQLYRIGAFIAVAILLIGASYLYQRFLAEDEGEEAEGDINDASPPAGDEKLK